MNEPHLWNYLIEAPAALAIERSLECAMMSGQRFVRPVLDLGCGDGLFTKILTDQMIDVGVEPDDNQLKQTQRRGHYHELLGDYGHNVSKKDCSVNTIIANSVLEHIKDIRPAIREARRLLAPGGHFYVTVPTDRFDQYTFFYQFFRALNCSVLAEKSRKAFIFDPYFLTYSTHNGQ